MGNQIVDDRYQNQCDYDFCAFWLLDSTPSAADGHCVIIDRVRQSQALEDIRDTLCDIENWMRQYHEDGIDNTSGITSALQDIQSALSNKARPDQIAPNDSPDLDTAFYDTLENVNKQNSERSETE